MSESQVPVKVALRIRPARVATDSERVGPKGFKTALTVIPDSPQVVIGRESDTSKKTFTFDHVFRPESSQEDVFNTVAKPLVQQFVEGFNGTILAYGQTFSGKTYTMGSSNNQKTLVEEVGVIPRIVDHVFSKIEADTRHTYAIRVSFLEIYQEQLRDLLMPDNESREMSIRESKDGIITISGIHEQPVKNKYSMLRCLEIGGFERTTGDTQVHQLSSRSHAIFTIILEQILHSPESNETAILKCSKLHLVDLAGSERLKRTGAEGLRLRESVKINSGLLALGNVISVLGSDKFAKGLDTHVPYRDSKLTRLLQDSLGGNSRTVMIACVSPLVDDMDETLNTLKYAYRARKIQNKPIVNTVDHQAVEMSSMQKQIADLQVQLSQVHLTGEPAQFTADMIDFENDQMMQHFMEELKNRTIRGTNAVKALDQVNLEKQALENSLNEAHHQIEELTATMALRDTTDVVPADYQQLSDDFEEFMNFVACIFRGDYPTPDQEERVLTLISRYRPEEELIPRVSATSPGNESRLILPPIQSTSIVARESSSHSRTSSNNAARSNRRKNLRDDPVETKLMPLEKEMLDSQTQIARLEAELKTAEGKFSESQRSLEHRLRIIQNLERMNDDLVAELGTLKAEKEDKEDVISIKVLNENGTQTMDRPLPVLETTEEFPVQLAKLGDPEGDDIPSREKLVSELNAAMKAKVELLRELSKANKEAEKMRHSHLDTAQKLERDLEAAHRDAIKLHSEQQEKDTAKEKMKEEYERKLKLQESQMHKMKTKLKDLDKAGRDKEQADRKLQEMALELEKMAAQHTAWKKKLKEDAERYTEIENRRTKETAASNKQIEDDSRKMRHLETQVEMMRKKLDRKSEEIAILSRKLRDSSLTTSGSMKSFRIASHERLLTQERAQDETSTQFSVPDVLSECDPNEQTESVRNRSVEIERFHNIGVRLKELKAKVDTLEQKINDTEDALSNTKGQDQTILLKELQQLRRDKTILLRHVVELRTEKRKAEALIDNPQKKSNIVIAEDDLDYADLVEKFADDDFIVELLPTVRTSSLQDSKKTIVDLFFKLHELKKSKTDSEPRRKLVDVELGTSSATLLTSSSQTELDVAPSRAQTANSNSQTAPAEDSDSKVSALERDVYYYRNANKELKTKLREIVAANQKLAKNMQKSHPSESGVPSFAVAVE